MGVSGDLSRKIGPEEKLAGLPYTPIQLFFIRFAQTWCEKHDPHTALRMTLEYRTSIGKFR